MLDETLNDMVSDDNSSRQKLLVAKVTYVDDPLNINRIKVRIPGRLDGDDSMLPWFAPFRLAPFGMGEGFGIYGSPPVGADVIVYLQNGDISSGFYVAGYHGVPQANSNFSGPNVWGFQDPSGTRMVFNMAAQTLTFFHSSGFTYTISANGSYTMQSPGAVTVNANDNVTVTARRIDLN